MDKVKTRIIWNGQGGELDSTTVTHKLDDDHAVARALIQMITGSIVNAGDSFIIQEVA